MIILKQAFDSFISLLDQLSNRRLWQVIAGTVGIIIVLVALIILQVQRTQKFYSRQMAHVNDARQETSELLAHNELLAQQQIKVETMLAQDRNFKLKEFVDSAIQRLGLAAAATSQELGMQETIISRTGQYTEVQLTITLSNINTKQLVDCLAEFEGNERVYVKKIEITKAKQQPVISAVIVIATLTPAIQNTGVLSLE
ncbi:hypothetical protein M1466_00065 [Candidatus Dependentiae bacterium]|nr:hypothetical protein [Candidatus Dependentiae bacterium]